MDMLTRIFHAIKRWFGAQEEKNEAPPVEVSKNDELARMRLEKDTALCEAAAKGDLAQARLLLADGARADGADRFKVSPLDFAARRGHREMAEFLMDNGAKIDAVDNYGNQPLHSAAWAGQRELAELLIDRGADVNAATLATEGHWRPLHVAALEGRRDVAELLLARGANVGAMNQFGCQALELAARAGHGDVVKLLVSSGARVEAQDNLDRQPLHSAAINGHGEVARLLIDKGEKVDAADHFGDQPLHLAASCGQGIFGLLGNMSFGNNLPSGYQEVVKVLLECGADPGALNKNGKTPRDLCRNAEVGKLLQEAEREWEENPDVRAQKALSAFRAQQRKRGRMRPPAPSL